MAVVGLGAAEEGGAFDDLGAADDCAEFCALDCWEGAALDRADCGGALVADGFPWPSGCDRVDRFGKPPSCARTVGAATRRRPARPIEGRMARSVKESVETRGRGAQTAEDTVRGWRG